MATFYHDRTLLEKRTFQRLVDTGYVLKHSLVTDVVEYLVIFVQTFYRRTGVSITSIFYSNYFGHTKYACAGVSYG